MVAIVSLVICLNIFLLATYDNPFSGDVTITPTAFQTQLQLFELELNPGTKPLEMRSTKPHLHDTIVLRAALGNSQGLPSSLVHYRHIQITL